MTLLVVGVNHQSAPTEVLEILAAQNSQALAQDAISGSNIAESLVVSTCNRVEIYAEVSRFHAAVEDIVAHLAKVSGLTIDELTASCYVHYDERAVNTCSRWLLAWTQWWSARRKFWAKSVPPWPQRKIWELPGANSMNSAKSHCA